MKTCQHAFSNFSLHLFDLTHRQIAKNNIFPWSHGVLALTVSTLLRNTFDTCFVLAKWFMVWRNNLHLCCYFARVVACTEKEFNIFVVFC